MIETSVENIRWFGDKEKGGPMNIKNEKVEKERGGRGEWIDGVWLFVQRIQNHYICDCVNKVEHATLGVSCLENTILKKGGEKK